MWEGGGMVGVGVGGSESGVHSDDGHRHPVGVVVSLHS